MFQDGEAGVVDGGDGVIDGGLAAPAVDDVSGEVDVGVAV